MSFNRKLYQMLLNKKVLVILFFLITFFAFNASVSAAYFNYSEFDFDAFAEKNKHYWTHSCIAIENEEEQEKCNETVLERQRHYYTTLYKLLAKYQKKGFIIDDNIIIMTSFFELDPGLFEDSGDYYRTLMGSDHAGYKVGDSSDIDSYDINQDDDDIDFFEQEKDTLKLLLKSMIGYPYVCYGKHGAPTETKNNDGTSSYSCKSGDLLLGGNECLTKAKDGHTGFWEYIMGKSKVLSFFGLKGEKKTECEGLAGEYPNGTNFVPGEGAEVSTNRYWEFLENSEYFDRKPHLQYRFGKILLATGKDNILDLDNDEKEEYKEELINIRKGIVEDIKYLLDNYGSQNMLSIYTNASSDSYWWPVGGSEITTDGAGKSYALGEPVSTNISSKFGPRIHPVTGVNSLHRGVDLVGTDGAAGVYNIIAAKSGIVTEAFSGCESFGDGSCGGGFGDYVILSHADGNYTVYAHLHQDTITVAVGESVNQGQVLGKMGSSGLSTGTHLHFEVRTGETSATAVDPLQYISASEPRKTSTTSGELETMLVCMEGKGPDDGGSNYKVYNDGFGTLTVGAGVTLRWQSEKFASRGINVANYNYAGALISKEIVDSIKSQILNEMYDSVNASLTSNGISLQSYQIDALVSRKYNTGNIDRFPSNYLTYGNTQNLYNNYMSNPVTSNGVFVQGLVNRRNYEWNLFHRGIYYTC